MITLQDVDEAWNIYWLLLEDAVRNNWPDGSWEVVGSAQSNYMSVQKQFIEEQSEKIEHEC